jgi:hypothetical protein
VSSSTTTATRCCSGRPTAGDTGARLTEGTRPSESRCSTCLVDSVLPRVHRGHDAATAPPRVRRRVPREPVLLGPDARQLRMSARRTAVGASLPPCTRRAYKLSEVLVDVVGVTDTGAYFPRRVAFHLTWHSSRLFKAADRQLGPLRAVRDLVELRVRFSSPAQLPNYPLKMRSRRPPMATLRARLTACGRTPLARRPRPQPGGLSDG